MLGLKAIAVMGSGAAVVMYAMAHASAAGADVAGTVDNGVRNVHGLPSDVSGGNSNIILTPNSGMPGDTVQISMPSCNKPLVGGKASSTVFAGGTVSLNQNPKPPAGLIGQAVIAANAQNGQWTVNVWCGEVAQPPAYISVYSGYTPPTDPPTEGPPAGGGGSVEKGDVGMTAGGIALVVGGVAYGAWSMRKRDMASGTHVG